MTKGSSAADQGDPYVESAMSGRFRSWATFEAWMSFNRHATLRESPGADAS